MSPDSSLLSPAIGFEQIPGWRDDNHAAALRAFRLGAALALAAPARTRGLGIPDESLRPAAAAALALPGDPHLDASRDFFETWFVPRRITVPGFVTGYFEPEVEARRKPDSRFRFPLYRRPADLVDVSPAGVPPGWDPAMRFARSGEGGLRPHVTRAEADGGALSGQGLELAWLESPVDAFFIHVQGSARLRLPGGEVMRIAFAAKSGHAYTSIGKIAVDEGILPLGGTDKDGLESWLRANPEAGAALMRRNESFIFFREVTELRPEQGPLGAAGAPLTPGRSLAVDRTLTAFHLPVWLDVPQLADLDRPERPFRRLLIAQDTGSAIVGPARGDIFFGSGAAAGSRAGKVRHSATMIVLEPAPAALRRKP